MKIRRLYVDSNIFIQLAEGQGEFVHLLMEVVRRPPSGDRSFFCTSEMTLAEVLTQPLRNADQRLISQYENWMTTSNWLEVEPVSRRILRMSAELRATNRALKLPDAIHLSTAWYLGCDHILSGDERLPRSLGSGSDLLRVIRPEAAVLQQIIQAGQP